MENEKEKSLRGTMVDMEVGECITVGMEKYNNARFYASNLGLTLGRKYSTSCDREKMTITIVREE